MNILKKVFFSIVLLVCCSSKTFFLLNKTSYDVMVEFWHLSNENIGRVDSLKLPAHRIIDILSYEDTKYTPASCYMYMLKFIFVDGNEAIIHTSFYSVFLKDIKQDIVILLSEDFEIKCLKATAQMKEAEQNMTIIPLAAPFFLGWFENVRII